MKLDFTQYYLKKAEMNDNSENESIEMIGGDPKSDQEILKNNDSVSRCIILITCLI